MLKYISKVCVLFLILNFAKVHAASFEGFTKLESNVIEGEITVHCSDDRADTVAHFSCKKETLDPGEFMYFVHEEGVDANYVILKATWENGKTQTKKKFFNSEKHRTLTQTNLWVESLLQNPLLSLGMNTIEYNFQKYGRSVASGEFKVLVERGPGRRCRRKTYYSLNAVDCRNRVWSCNHYFSDENYCRK